MVRDGHRGAGGLSGAGSGGSRVGERALLLHWLRSRNLLIRFTVTYACSLCSGTLRCLQIVAGGLSRPLLSDWGRVVRVSARLGSLEHGIGVLSGQLRLLVLFRHHR